MRNFPLVEDPFLGQGICNLPELFPPPRREIRVVPIEVENARYGHDGLPPIR